MTMSDTIMVTLIIVGFLIAFPALWLTCIGFWRPTVERAATRASKNPYKSFMLGLVITGGVGFVSGVAGSAMGAPGAAISIAVVCVYFVFSACGLAGLVTYLGQKLPSPIDEGRPWRATLRGGIALELTYLLPFLGWFGIMPISWVLGAGACGLAFFDRVRADVPAVAPAEAELVTFTAVSPAPAIGQPQTEHPVDGASLAAKAV